MLFLAPVLDAEGREWLDNVRHVDLDEVHGLAPAEWRWRELGDDCAAVIQPLAQASFRIATEVIPLHRQADGFQRRWDKARSRRAVALGRVEKIHTLCLSRACKRFEVPSVLFIFHIPVDS